MAQPFATPSFTARLLDINRRVDETNLWTDMMLNGRGISYHDVQLDITTTLDVANLGQTIEVFDTAADTFVRENGKFLAIPDPTDRPYAEHADVPDRPYPNGTIFPGGDGWDFGVLLEAEVTIPVGRWQIAFGSDAGGWIHLENPAPDGPLPMPGEEPVPNPLGFFRRKNENEPLYAAFFGMSDSALWYNAPRKFGWTGAAFDTREFDEPVTTTLRAFFFETDGLDGLEIVIRDTDDGLVALDRHIGPDNTLLPEEHDWRLLQDGEYGWEVRPAPANVEIERSPQNPNDPPEIHALTLPVMQISGKGVIGPASHQAELIIRERPDPGEPPVYVPGVVKARRYFVPDFDEFDTVEKAHEFIVDQETPTNIHREPVAQGFIDSIAWRSGDFYPPALGFPVRESLPNSPNEYGVLVEGELLIPAGQRTIQFKDANDRFAGFVLDLDGDGDLDDDRQNPIIDDADPAESLDGRGSPLSPALISGSLDTEEDRWRRFEFYMADDFENATTNRFLNPDSALLAWDQNVSGDVFFPDFPADPDAPLSPEHVIGPESFRAQVETILDGELLLDMDEFADPATGEITLVFEVNADEEKWDSMGIRDTLEPDFIVGDPNNFAARLDFGNADIVVDITQGVPTDGFTIDLVDETVDTILIQGLDADEWAEIGSSAWQESFVFTFGLDEQWDLSEFLQSGIIRYGELASIEGDYNNNGRVEQGDLDLVLLNWGDDTPPIPDGWVNDLPEGRIDQQELDGVLLNWGNSLPSAGAATAVPEPGTRLLFALIVALMSVYQVVRRAAMCLRPRPCPSAGCARRHWDIGRPTYGRKASCRPMIAVIAVAWSATSPALAQTDVNGFTGRLLDVSTVPNEHAEALAFLQGIGLDSPQVQADVFDLVPFADFGGSLRGDFFGGTGTTPDDRGLPYPGGEHFPGNDGESFVVSLEAEVIIPAGTWQIAFGTGDGGAIRVDGVHFSERYNDVDRMVGSFFNLDHDLIIYDNNRGPNARGEDRGWTGGTFTVNAPTTTRLIHTFHQTPHGLGDNHLSEIIIRNADQSSVIIDEADGTGQQFIPLANDGWELLAPTAHDWQVRSTLDQIAGPIDPTQVGPIDHVGGKGLIGSVLRNDDQPHVLAGPLDDIGTSDERNRKLLVRRYALDDTFQPPFPDPVETAEDRAATNTYIAEWIQDRDPEHLGYISHVEWKSGTHYPEGLGFDDPSGNEDNYLVVLEGQVFVPQHDLDAEDRKQIRFKDGTADYSGLVLELGDAPDRVRDIFWDAEPSRLDGSDGSPIRTGVFDFSGPIIPGEGKGWIDFTYYMYAEEGDDNALLAWDENALTSQVAGSAPFPEDRTEPIPVEHIIRPESFRLREYEQSERVDGQVGGRIILNPDNIQSRPPDPDNPTAPPEREIRIEADLAVFRDEESPARSPMVVFEIDPLTGRSDTVGIKKIDPRVLTGDDRDVIQVGVLDVGDTHVLVDALSVPEPNSTFDLLEGSVDELVGTPEFTFRVADDPRLNNSALWDVSQFAREDTLGQIRFRGLSAAGTVIPEPGTLALAVLLVLCWRGNRPLAWPRKAQHEMTCGETGTTTGMPVRATS